MVSDFPLSISTLENKLPCLSLSFQVDNFPWLEEFHGLCLGDLLSPMCRPWIKSLAISFTTSTFWAETTIVTLFFLFFLVWFGYLLLSPPFLLSGTKTPQSLSNSPHSPTFLFLSLTWFNSLFLSSSLFFMPLSPSI